ncbi:MAG: efflux RND transporter periplasmic adaptor subunit, partial [Bacteroidales bacterium]|nr:efflux RND transporter periplasmic adaptor subunit [Bacteroidales bacterium]MDD4830358.1 efflux RND transporter periplasmic adaptor subunit [Bacteroidales bacterium]
ANISEKGVAGDMLSHTYDVRIKINNSRNELLPGMVCNVSILKKGETENIVLPNSCIQIGNDNNKFVWIDNNGLAEKRIIQTGGFVGDGVIVSGGLSDGDKVIVEGNNKVSQGMKIRVK